MRRLLFLNGIKAFEAAARTGSFAAAGAELNVSAAAVSRMVHLLEDRLGVALFERKANRLATTAAGRAYQGGLTPIFDALASLTAQVTAPSSVRVLTIGVGPTFAMKWLIPRLADFRKSEPDIDVRITTGGAAVPFGEDWSCGIKLGDGEWPGLIVEPLFAADLLPVCAPRLANALKRPTDLKGPTLLRVAHSPDDWPSWLEAAGTGRITARGPEFEFYGQALQAAVDGLGIAMGIRPYIDDDLAAGRLVAPFALSVPKGMRWYLVYRGFSTEQRDFAAFRRWIIRAAAEPAMRRRARDMPDEKIETLVIGGGQAGLVMSHRLKERGLSHLVLERHRIAERWRSERWDGLKFQFPNWSVRLPDFPFPHSDPDAFANTDDIIRYIEAYAGFVNPPIRCGVAVTRLSKRDGTGFIAETTDGTIAADNVVVATGPYQRNLVPDLLHNHPVFQVHAADYKNPGQLPPGAVLVAGAGASGAQIAEELLQAGRRVYLSIGRHRRLPRRYRGRDLVWWLAEMRLDQVTPEERGPARLGPVISGAYGGRTIDFRNFAADGMILVGRIEAAHGGVIEIAPGLAESMTDGDLVYTTFLDTVDAYVKRRRMELPEDPDARATFADPPCVTAPLTHLDLAAEGISAVIWATGYGVDFGWIDLAVTDAKGEAVHRNGISAVPGLYFLGLQWLSKMNSSFLSGVGDDAAVLADHILARG